MLTGAPPFLSEGFGDVLLMHLTQPPRPLRELQPAIPPSLEQLVLHALEKEPERRLASMDELLRGLLGPAARTTVRHGVDPSDPQYAETDVIPRLRAGSSQRRTTFSSTASQVMGDTERLSVRRRRLAVGAVVAAAVAVAGITALTARRGDTSGISLARPPETKLSAGAVQAPTPSAAQAAIPAPDPVVPASPPPAAPPRATAEIDQAPAADPPTLTPRRAGAGKPTKGRFRKPAAAAAQAAEVRSGAAAPRPAAPLLEFAPLPDKPAGPATTPAPAASPPAPSPAASRATVPVAGAPAKPRLSTDKW
jgi:hypothetical protein